MDPILLRDGQSGATAKILPGFGFNCYSFCVPTHGEVIEVLDAESGFEAGEAPASGSGIPLLFPFPNRIRDGRFRWAGSEYQLSHLDGDGNAIHGFVLDRPWRIIGQGGNFAVGEFQLSADAPDRAAEWPADFLIQVRYELQDSSLNCRIRIENPGNSLLPWGFGTHPYFRMPLKSASSIEDCLVEVPATRRWELIDCLPTGRTLPVDDRTDLRDGPSLGGRKLDDVLTGVEHDGKCVETSLWDPAAGLQLTQRSDTIFRELVVYMPPHGRSVCLEPYTCVTDAINLEQQGIDAGWEVLKPGEEVLTGIDITLSQIVV